MPIRIRIILFLVLLSLYPWSSVQYLRESEKNTRSLEADYLSDRISDIAQLVSFNANSSSGNSANSPSAQLHNGKLTANDLHFHPLATPPRIDGYEDNEWVDVPKNVLNGSNPKFSADYQAAINNGQLYLLINVKDATPTSQNYYRSLLANGDYLGVKLGSGRTYYLRLSSPGNIDVYYLGNNDTLRRSTDINAHWQAQEKSYQVELTIELRDAKSRFGFFVVNAGNDTSRPPSTVGNITTYQRFNGIYPIVDGRMPAHFTHYEQSLADTLLHFTSAGLRLHVINSQCQTLATAGRISELKEQDASWFTKTIYNWVLFSGSTENYNRNQSFACSQHFDPGIVTSKPSLWTVEYTNDLVAYAALSLQEGRYSKSILIAEQSRDRYVMFNDQSFGSYLYYTLGISLFIITIIGLYLSIWSWRLRALNRAAQLVIDEGGDVSSGFKASQSADEIGQLSRNYGSLLEQIRSHNDYLKTLAQKLSHEMRTPLAIVSTSLDNLSSDSERKVYLERARDGVHRLSYIMTSMGQAKKIEEAIQYAEFEMVNVGDLLAEACDAYEKVYEQHRIEYVPPESNKAVSNKTATIKASAELLIQMLDKLVDNAVDFSATGSPIRVVLENGSKEIQIKVINSGSLLAEGNHDALFQQLVSFRDETDKRPHLGLGLFITRLIAEHHGGSVSASNLDDKSGVCFSVSLPSYRDKQKS